MAEAFFDLSPNDRYDALQVVASRSGRPAHLLEKDIWVVWTLSALFDAPFAQEIVLKGGTSLSKGYQAIERFSEDVDLYETAVRGGLQLVPDGAAEEALAADYADMVAGGLLLEEASDFPTLVAQYREIQDRANKVS